MTIRSLMVLPLAATLTAFAQEAPATSSQSQLRRNAEQLNDFSERF